MSKTTKHVVYGAVLVAMAVVLTIFVRFPIFPAAPFLEYDMGDVPLFFGAILLGPWTGLIITLAACIIQGLTVSAGSGFLGILMHFIATGSFVLCAGLIARKKKNQRLLPALSFGAVTQVLLMIPLNLIITPAFFVEGNVFASVAENARFCLSVFTAFPRGFLGIAAGAVAAAAFMTAFVMCIVYTDDNGRGKQKRGLNITAKGTLFGILAGVIYGALALLVMNLLFGNPVAPEGVEGVVGMMYSVIVPFNAIKAGGNALIAMVLYYILGHRIVI